MKTKPPKYCPNCGKEFTGENAVVALLTEEIDGTVVTIYDCYCEHCDWSGEIHPDWEVEE